MMIASLNGKIVIADKDTVRSDEYICPACKERVILKKGRTKLPHFAHRSGSMCASSEGETAEHLLGKRQIYDWAQQKYYQPEYEVYYPKIKQRPDIVIEINQQRRAIEFQCSPLSNRRMSERNTGYRKIKMPVLWVLGKTYRRNLGFDKIAQFTQVVDGKKCLVYWNTSNEQFEYVFELKKCELCTTVQKSVNIRLVQTKTIDQKLMSKAHDIRQIQSLCYKAHRDMRTIPLVAHYIERGWPIMSGPRTYYQVRVLLKLEKFELGFRFKWDKWFEMLVYLGAEQWLSFECIDIERDRAKYIYEFTQKLIAAGILANFENTLKLTSYPKWFSSIEIKMNALKNAS